MLLMREPINPKTYRSLQILVAGKSARALNQMGQIPREQEHLYTRFLALLRDSMHQDNHTGAGRCITNADADADADIDIVATGSSYLSEQEQAMEEAISTMFAFRTATVSVAHESQSPAPPEATSSCVTRPERETKTTVRRSGRGPAENVAP